MPTIKYKSLPLPIAPRKLATCSTLYPQNISIWKNRKQNCMIPGCLFFNLYGTHTESSPFLWVNNSGKHMTEGNKSVMITDLTGWQFAIIKIRKNDPGSFSSFQQLRNIFKVKYFKLCSLWKHIKLFILSQGTWLLRAAYLHLFLQDYFCNLFTVSEMASLIKAGISLHKVQ